MHRLAQTGIATPTDREPGLGRFRSTAVLECRIVCTTPSPYLLDLFEPTEVRVLALDAERRARPLVEHPDFDRWKFGMQTGELWVALGEGWVTARARSHR
jgi:hypothetical protein